MSTMSVTSATATPPEIFGRRVKEVRESRRLKQGELAKLMGIDRTTLNKIERGSRGDVSITQLFAFAAALRISPLYLLTPADGSEPVDVTTDLRLSAAEARGWIRGLLPLPGTDPIDYFLDLPRDEQRAVLEQQREAQFRAQPLGNLARAARGGLEPTSDQEIDRFIERLTQQKKGGDDV
jgi:transcriptional regulator with XRE-family HTH domain